MTDQTLAVNDAGRIEVDLLRVVVNDARVLAAPLCFRPVNFALPLTPEPDVCKHVTERAGGECLRCVRVCVCGLKAGRRTPRVRARMRPVNVRALTGTQYQRRRLNVVLLLPVRHFAVAGVV